MDLLERARALAATTVLGDVAAPTLIALAERAAVIELDPGASVSTRRPDGVVVIVVARGALEIDGERAVAGEVVGAAGALDGAAEGVTARALEASVVLEVGQDDFVDVLAEHPVAARALARALAKRLRGARA